MFPRHLLYTNPTVQYYETIKVREHPYAHLQIDSWYLGEYSYPDGKTSTLGTMDIGRGPLHAKTGIGSFLVEQLHILDDAFIGFLRFSGIHTMNKPMLEYPLSTGAYFQFPKDETGWEALSISFDHFTQSIVSFYLWYDMLVTIRDGQGGFVQEWLPDAGIISYQAEYTSGYESLRTSPVQLGILTPAAQQGYAMWSVRLICDVVSIFYSDNSDVLQRPRSNWLAQKSANSDDNESDTNSIMTLISVPEGTPTDNREIAIANRPSLYVAIHKWCSTLNSKFDWLIPPEQF